MERGAGRLDSTIAAVFDSAFYASRQSDTDGVEAAGAFEHYWRAGRFRDRSPLPLFDCAYYRRQLRGERGVKDLFAHYLDRGAAAGLDPHPLFDSRWYAAAAGGLPPNENPLLHYLAIGRHSGLSPHPLFDPAYYLTFGEPPPEGRDPLSAYLTQGSFEDTPHYLFSDVLYVAEAARELGIGHAHAYRGGPPLVHYVLHGARRDIKTHPLFEPATYRENLARHLAAFPDAALEHSLRAMADPLRHYVEVGASLGISPTPFFDPEFYRGQVGDTAGDPLRHYLQPSGFGSASPHPGIDLDHYEAVGGFARDDVPSVLHLLATPSAALVSPNPAFDVERYKATYPDLRDGGVSPVLHFLEHGIAEDRSLNAYFSQAYVFNSAPRHDFRTESAARYYLSGRMDRSVRVVFVSHDAGLTGAPGTVLRLMEDFGRYSSVECFAIVGGHGPRVPDFQRAGHTLVLGTAPYATPPERIREAVAQLLAVTAGNEPIVAIVNSAESRHVGSELARVGIPVITLVHEAADLYPAGEFDPIVETSERIVFGSQFVCDRARSVLRLPPDKVIVRGQGLQQDHVGTMNRAAAREAVLRELRLADDTFLVLGCGTVDYRKGADLFVAAAIEYLKSSDAGRPSCFIWVGQGQSGPFRSFLTNAIRAEDRSAEIRFIGERTDVEPYFMASDAFLMTSRVDPFPCVCQEAMASGLPIVAFTEGGGTIEMIGEEAGFCVPLGDTSAMAERLRRLAGDEPLRQAIGAKGRQIVRSRWDAVAYADFVAALAADVSGVPLERFGPPAAPPAQSERRIFVALEDWRPSAKALQAEALVGHLTAAGYRAELLLTRGRFTSRPPLASFGLPTVPFRFLQPDSVGFFEGGWRTSRAAIWHALQRLLRQVQPCVVIALDDPLVAALGPILPSRVGLVGVLAGPAPEEVHRVCADAGYMDHVLAFGEDAANALLTLNPALSGRTTVVRPVALDQRRAHPGRRSSKNGSIYVRLEAAAPDAATAVLELRRELERRGLEQVVRVHVDDLPAGSSVGTFSSRAGLGEGELLLGPGSRRIVAALDEAEVAVFLEGGNATLVAMAMAAGAAPVVHMPSRAVREVLQDGRLGVVAGGGPRRLAETVVNLVTAPDQRASLVRAAQHSPHLDPDRTADAAARLSAALDAIFDELASEGSGRRVALAESLHAVSADTAPLMS